MSIKPYNLDADFVKARSYARALARMAGKPGNQSAVYFIAPVDGGAVKIGTSADPAKRFAAIQSHSPLELHFLAIAPGGRALEGAYHSMFEQERLHGEWFSPSERLLAEVECLVRRWVG